MDINAAWENFLSDSPNENKENSEISLTTTDFKPHCSDIYISTQTKIANLNQEINLYNIFWQLDVLPYQHRGEGIIKKQMKVNCIDLNSSRELDKKIKETTQYISVDTISKINNPNGRKVQYKDVRKINIGLCKKDLTSYRIQKRGAFYNCFVLILRIKIDEKFKEFHIKVFNTGKLELPGIQNTNDLITVLKKIKNILQPFVKTELMYNYDNIKTVLINSNFKCNYYIDRDVLANILKYDYNLHVVYDPCSYPGIQCKFYYNTEYKDNNGVCSCKNKCTKSSKSLNKKCSEISFMIFRTGSVLIVGKCNETILHHVYNFIKNILIKKYSMFIIKTPDIEKKVKQKKLWKKTIYIDSNYTTNL